MILEKDKKPPAPYVHQDYPRVVYGPKVAHKKVNDADEEKALGWSRTPPPPPPDPDAEPAMEPVLEAEEELTRAQKAVAAKAAKNAAKSTV
jgi:hypothetical protein